MTKRFLLFPILSSILFSCKSQPNFNYPIDYTINQPEVKLILEEELNEISGICIDSEGQQFIGIADEKGIIYLIDSNTGKILNRIIFHKDGDYEDVELIGKDLYILKSSGTLYLIRDVLNAKSIEFEKFNTALEVSNDVEGLCYDKQQNSLLLACKASSKLNTEITDEEQERAIYRFDLKTHTLDEKPILIKKDAFLSFVKSHPELPKSKKWLERFGPSTKNFSFEPSAIAIQESTGRYYVLSSVGKMLAVFKPDWQLHTLIKLDKEKFIQPEGICFDKAENLYICNEGKTQEAIIYKFDRK